MKIQYYIQGITEPEKAEQLTRALKDALCGFEVALTEENTQIEISCPEECAVTARAVAPSPKIYRETDKFTKRSGKWIFYKTPGQAAEELPELQKSKLIRWEVSPEIALPGDAGTRLFVTGQRLK